MSYERESVWFGIAAGGAVVVMAASALAVLLALGLVVVAGWAV